MHPPTSPSPPKKFSRSERVILRRNLFGEELVQNGHLLHYVVAHLGHLGEEPQREETGYAAEAAGENATVSYV